MSSADFRTRLCTCRHWKAQHPKIWNNNLHTSFDQCRFFGCDCPSFVPLLKPRGPVQALLDRLSHFQIDFQQLWDQFSDLGQHDATRQAEADKKETEAIGRFKR